MPGKLRKAEDGMKALSSLNEIFGKLKEQAEQGQIDGALLDQAGAVLNVAMDTAANPHGENASEAADAAGSGVVEAPGTPSMPPMSKEEGEPESTEAPAQEEAVAEESVPEETEMSEDKKSTVFKGDLPLEGRPPIKTYNSPNLVFDQAEEMRAKLPGFVKALESGSMKDAQRIAGGSQIAFDTMLNLGMRALLTEGGWTTDNMSKLGGMAQSDPNGLSKAFTAASVPGIYLIRLAKMMLPVYAGIVNRIPSQSPTGMAGTQATWKAQLGFGSLGEASVFRTAEAAIGSEPPTSFLTFNAPFNDVAYSDSVTLKAIAAGRGYSDPLQLSVIKTMSAVLRTQERIILGSNVAAIPTPGTITATITDGGTIAAGSYVFGVTALTYEGWLSSAAGGTSTTGETTWSASGSSQITSTIITASGSKVVLTWAAVPGAVAYNIYTAASAQYAGSALGYLKTVLTNKTSITTTPTTATGSLAPVSGSGTTGNSYGIEGLIPWCTGSYVYSNAIPTKVNIYDNAGAGLTGANGGIAQIDYQLEKCWTNWQIAPSVMLMSPNMNSTLVGKIMGLNSGATYRIEVSQERGGINGGMMVTGYTNKFSPFADGTPRYIDIIPHPYMPDGTILMLAETIPYPMGNETRGFVRDVLLPYTYFPLASTTNKYNYSITTSETLECFNPSPQCAIVGIDYTA
jgi:hypothetical protein